MRVTIGSPIYDRPEPAMVMCLIATLDLLRERGHKADWRYASTIVHYARNFLMADMLRHEPDVLVQIDGDHQWDAADVVDAIEAVGEGHADVIGFAHLDRKPSSAYEPPLWVSPAVPDKIAGYGFERGDRHYIEADAVGGGILVISRSCAVKMSANVPLQRMGNVPKVFEFAAGEGGEDVFFCERWRAMGGKVHCDMTSLVGHIGKHVFAMNPAHLLAQLVLEDR